MYVAPVLALHTPLAIEKDYTSDSMKLNPSNLLGWSRQVMDSVNTMAGNQRDHDTYLTKLVEKITTMEEEYADMKDFKAFIAGAHPEIIIEYLRNRDASKRIAP